MEFVLDFFLLLPKLVALSLTGRLSECGPHLLAFSWIALISLVAGAALAVRSADKRLLLLLISPLLSNLWVAATGWKLANTAWLLFICSHLIIFALTVGFLRRGRVAAVLIAISFSCYVLLTALVDHHRFFWEGHMYESDEHRPPACVYQFLHTTSGL